MISDDDFLYGSRSGIQKAIRRCDLDLAMTCFDALWSVNTHRNWLKWRACTLVTEEAWQMIGELGKLKESMSDDEKDWRKFIYSLTLATKSKDAHGLWEVARLMPELDEEHPEYLAMLAWWGQCNDNPVTIVDELYDACLDVREYSDYERAGMKVLKSRCHMGGMWGDRCITLSTLVMMSARKPITEKEVKIDVKKGANKWKVRTGRDKPKTVDIPWYCFDMHTQAGKIARSIFMKHKAKKYDIDVEQFNAISFYLESAFNPKGAVKWVPKFNHDRKFTPFETAWWLPHLKDMLQMGKRPPKVIKKMWANGMREDLRGAVNWILEKRASK